MVRSSPGFCVVLSQRLMAAQNRRIDQLMEKIQQQQDKLEKQSVHLQALQSKVSATSSQDPQRESLMRFQFVQENLIILHLVGWTEESQVPSTERQRDDAERRQAAER